jgi:hypothetical protein
MTDQIQDNLNRLDELYKTCFAMTHGQGHTLIVRLLREVLLPKVTETHGARAALKQCVKALDGFGDRHDAMKAARGTMDDAEAAAKVSNGSWNDVAAFRCAHAGHVALAAGHTCLVVETVIQALFEVAGAEGAPDVQVGAHAPVTAKAILDRIMPIVDEIAHQPEGGNDEA